MKCFKTLGLKNLFPDKSCQFPSSSLILFQNIRSVQENLKRKLFCSSEVHVILDLVLCEIKLDDLHKRLYVKHPSENHLQLSF